MVDLSPCVSLCVSVSPALSLSLSVTLCLSLSVPTSETVIEVIVVALSHAPGRGVSVLRGDYTNLLAKRCDREPGRVERERSPPGD